MAEWPHVVIVGGGFAGLKACHVLAGQPVRVTLIDRRNFNLFQPLLYQVASGQVSEADVAPLSSGPCWWSMDWSMPIPEGVPGTPGRLG